MTGPLDARGPAIVVDIRSATPVYEQIRSQVAGAVTAGQLRNGDRLPAVRALAADLGIAVNTVTRAYTELESAGIIATRRRAGTVVVGAAAAPADVVGESERLVRHASEAGLADEAIIDLVRSALSRSRRDVAPA